MPIPLLYGLLVGLAQLFATLVMFALGYHGSADGLKRGQEVESLIGFILLMIILSFAHRAAKAAYGKGEALSFRVAARFSALTALVGALVTGCGQFVYLSYINPQVREIRKAQVMRDAQDYLAKLSPEQAAEELRKIEFGTSNFLVSTLHGFNVLFFGTLLGIAFALIFRAAIKRDEKAAAAAPK